MRAKVCFYLAVTATLVFLIGAPLLYAHYHPAGARERCLAEGRVLVPIGWSEESHSECDADGCVLWTERQLTQDCVAREGLPDLMTRFVRGAWRPERVGR